MHVSRTALITLNGGSSSIKFSAVIREDGTVLRGYYEGIGTTQSTRVWWREGQDAFSTLLHLSSTEQALADLVRCMEEVFGACVVVGVGHRIVHGFGRADHARCTPELLRDLEHHAGVVPEHAPVELALCRAAIGRFPDAVHVACFDTVFHANMPEVARRLPIPHLSHDAGMLRYGFHGLSCQSVVEAIVARHGTLPRRLVVLHLGSGASVTAILDGHSVDTTMGYTPTGGIVMSSRTGDIDPGVVLALMEEGGYSVTQMRHLLNHESGLKGVSHTSPDMRILLEQEGMHPDIAIAVSLFVRSAAQAVARMAVSLGGVDHMAFAGGMGEHSAIIRRRICAELAFLGVHLDDTANQEHRETISLPESAVSVSVTPTDEEAVMRRIVGRFTSSSH